MEFGVVGEVKAKLVHEKTDAAVVVADENVDALDAKVGGGPRRWSRSGHGEIIRGEEERRKKYELIQIVPQTLITIVGKGLWSWLD